MTEKFDPKETAHTIEKAGYIMLHGSWGLTFADLAGDMGQLNPNQVKEVSNQISWDNLKPNGLPKVEMSVGVDGHIQGFTFEPAYSDLRHPVTPYLIVTTGHKDTGVPVPKYVPAPHKHKIPDFQH